MVAATKNQRAAPLLATPDIQRHWNATENKQRQCQNKKSVAQVPQREGEDATTGHALALSQLRVARFETHARVSSSVTCVSSPPPRYWVFFPVGEIVGIRGCRKVRPYR